MRSGYLIGIGAFIFLLVSVIWWFHRYERRVVEFQAGASGEATYNQLLAAERLLTRLGVTADSRAGIDPTDWLPDYEDTLVLDNDAARYSGEAVDVLLEWVSAGGRLVIRAPATNENVPLLDELEIRIVIIEDDHEDIDAAEYFDLGNAGHARLKYDGSEPYEEETDEHGVVLLRLWYGYGSVTTLPDLTFMHNASIGDEGNAERFVGEILLKAGLPGAVWFVYSDEFPSLLDLLWTYARWALLLGGLLLVLFLWNRGQRFTAILPPEKPVRRSLIEHIDAVGRFNWRRNNGAALAIAAREAALERYYRQYGGGDQTITDELVKGVAARTGFTEAHVRFILTTPQVTGTGEFTTWIQSMQRIWKQQ